MLACWQSPISLSPFMAEHKSPNRREIGRKLEQGFLHIQWRRRGEFSRFRWEGGKLLRQEAKNERKLAGRAMKGKCLLLDPSKLKHNIFDNFCTETQKDMFFLQIKHCCFLYWRPLRRTDINKRVPFFGNKKGCSKLWPILHCKSFQKTGLLFSKVHGFDFFLKKYGGKVADWNLGWLIFKLDLYRSRKKMKFWVVVSFSQILSPVLKIDVTEKDILIVQSCFFFFLQKWT